VADGALLSEQGRGVDRLGGGRQRGGQGEQGEGQGLHGSILPPDPAAGNGRPLLPGLALLAVRGLVGLAQARDLLLREQPAQRGVQMVERGPAAADAAPGLRVYQLETTIDALIPFPLWAQGPSRQPTAVPPGRAFLVAAVGNPERFRADVLRLGIDITGERFFRDHTWLGQTAWDECCRRARQSGADCMLTTEKDAIKIGKPPKFPVTVCVQVARVAERVDFANLVRRVAGEEV